VTRPNFLLTRWLFYLVKKAHKLQLIIVIFSSTQSFRWEKSHTRHAMPLIVQLMSLLSHYKIGANRNWNRNEIKVKNYRLNVHVNNEDGQLWQNYQHSNFRYLRKQAAHKLVLLPWSFFVTDYNNTLLLIWRLSNFDVLQCDCTKRGHLGKFEGCEHIADFRIRTGPGELVTISLFELDFWLANLKICLTSLGWCSRRVTFSCRNCDCIFRWLSVIARCTE